ncbi:hypothetical protein ARMSODRAFT_981286 [Armillaria solidipes]|uniref:Uncharacterized protein n=1 Tax=Armillaria solidipes TaxID=1076256 RepID=A0A2H3AYC3_9AGAR|nr:hypothetical protein ARMSODRAFT_981286 [Armillaria solidipes]
MAYPTSHGAPYQGDRTTVAYPPLPSHAPVHTISNGGNVRSSLATHRSSSRNEPSTALVPYNPTVAARNRATSNARNDPPNQGRNPSSALVPYTGQPSTASHGQNSIPFPRQDAPRNRVTSEAYNRERNQASTQVPQTALRPSTTAPRQRARDVSNASTSSCSTCSSTSSSSGARSSTEVAHVRAGGSARALVMTGTFDHGIWVQPSVISLHDKLQWGTPACRVDILPKCRTRAAITFEQPDS